MLFAILYAVVRFLLDALLIRRQSEARLQAEVLALRHQLRVLQRQVGRPRWQSIDRIFLSALSRILPRASWSSLLPSSETLLRWHRELLRRRWAAYRSRPPRPRSEARARLHQLIVQLAEQNPRWGYRSPTRCSASAGMTTCVVQLDWSFSRRLPPEIRESELREQLVRYTASPSRTRWCTCFRRANAWGVARLSPAPLGRACWNRQADRREQSRWLSGRGAWRWQALPARRWPTGRPGSAARPLACKC